MAKQRLKLIVSSPAWRAKGRYKINENVSYSGKNWQNSTGINSEPGIGSDWVEVGGGGGALHRVLIDNNVDGSLFVTGTTAEVLLKTYTFPIGFFPPDSVVEFEINFLKTGTNGTLGFRFGVGTISGGQLPYHSQGYIASTSYLKSIRSCNIKNNLINGYGPGGSFATDITANASGARTLPFDTNTVITMPLYVTAGSELDSIRLQNLTIKVYKNV